MILSGSPLDYLWAFLGGFLTCLTPCVYPLIPLTAGFIGVEATGSRLKGFTLSFIYVTGIAITYSLLGLFASLTGRIFGSVSSSPLTYFALGAIVILFGISMLDAFTIPLPNIVKLPALKKHNYLSTFLLGLGSGLIVGPCLTPVLGSILAYLVTRKNILYGATLLLTFAYGMGLPLLLIGASSSVIFSLPKSGRWLIFIKRACAVILILAGAYFIWVGFRRL